MKYNWMMGGRYRYKREMREQNRYGVYTILTLYPKIKTNEFNWRKDETCRNL